MRLIRLADRPVTAWRNGGGQTRVVAQEPPGADDDRFSWRLSVAQVDRSGPFSAYPGIERQLILAGTESLTLVIDGRRHVLRPGDVTAFDGGARVSGEVSSGPVTAVNLMTRPDRVTAQVRIQDAAAGLVVGPTAGSEATEGTEVLAVALTRHTTLGPGGDALDALDALGTVWLGAGERVQLFGGTVAVITLRSQNV